MRPERLIEDFIEGSWGQSHDGHMCGEIKSVSNVREEASE